MLRMLGEPNLFTKGWVRCEYLPNQQLGIVLAAGSSRVTTPQVVEGAWHETHMERICSILYHGTIMPRRPSVPGSRISGGIEAVYTSQDPLRSNAEN